LQNNAITFYFAYSQLLQYIDIIEVVQVTTSTYLLEFMNITDDTVHLSTLKISYFSHFLLPESDTKYTAKAVPLLKSQ
jgi:hypothetical protein